MQSIFKFSRVYNQGNYLLNNKKINGAWPSRMQHNPAPSQPLPLAVAYQPRQVETNRWHLEAPRPTSSPNHNQTFRMILPPPNVTGNLHLGHALMATVQDVICRQQRQLGYDVQWVPGTDHAGIATQVVVEKKLLKERCLTRHNLGRKAFLMEVWNWKRKKVDSIENDLLKLGCALHWEKEYFTMDERQAHAVNVAFVRLFDEGLIQRKKSLVNWSCALESAISDIEVDMLEIKGPTSLSVPGHERNVEFGHIYEIAYPLCNSEEEIVVATTRPETVLGDVAVAVHPEDNRYLKYRCKEVKLWHPFRNEPIPLIFDVAVDPKFGTGAVKITPAHDKNDFAIAERHLLEVIPVFTEQGKITEKFAQFRSLPRFEAREHIINTLSELELLRSTKPHVMSLPICSRSKDVIEYMVRPQWFLHCQSMADAALSEVASGRLRIVPENFEIDWHRWLENCHDWCISRQLWWGHQIPAYLATDTNGEHCWVAAMDKAEALQKASEKLNTEVLNVERDKDVLDTWFSSALLPFSVFNWPNDDYKQNYPLDLMETGHDILFFWVARMVMLGLKLTGVAPFKTILLNGILCDAHGRKMSKSLGNVVTPQQVVQGATLESLQQDINSSYETGIITAEELKKSLKGLQKMFPNGIPECGTDALRFTLCSHNIKNHFINFDVKECYTNKLFLNKIWQATRFTLGAGLKLTLPLHEIESMNNVQLGKWDRWIMSRLADSLTTVAQSFDEYNLHVATAALKEFFYNNLCDVYLETTKSDINKGSANGYIHCATLATCLSWGLQSMSVFTPFIAAELLQHLPQNVQMNLSKFYDAKLEAEIGEVLSICQSIRQLKSRKQISKKHDPQVRLFIQERSVMDLLLPHLTEICLLTKALSVDAVLVSEKELRALRRSYDFFSTAGHRCSFGIKVNRFYREIRQESMYGYDVKDLNQQKLDKLKAELERYRLRSQNEGFLRSASAHTQQRHKDKIHKLELEIQNIKNISS